MKVWVADYEAESGERGDFDGMRQVFSSRVAAFDWLRSTLSMRIDVEPSIIDDSAVAQDVYAYDEDGRLWEVSWSVYEFEVRS